MRLLIGSDSEHTAVIRAANEMHASDSRTALLVLLGAADTFAFRPRPSTILVPGMPAGVIAAVPSLEEFGIASRLASEAGLPGCYDGTVVELAAAWLKSVEAAERADLEVYVANADAAREFGQSLQLNVQTLPA